MKNAALKKTIYSLPVLLELLWAANRRYLEFISTLDDPSSGLRDLEKIARPVRDGERSLPGFNLFDGEDLDLFLALVRGPTLSRLPPGRAGVARLRAGGRRRSSNNRSRRAQRPRV